MLFVHILFILWIIEAALATASVWGMRETLAPPLLPLPEAPPAVIISPIKGTGPFLPAYLARVRAQTYPNARVLIVVEADDPAQPVIEAACEGEGLPVKVIIASPSRDCGQKVWNLLTALEHLEPQDEIVAFIDADTLPEPDWLHRLASPLIRRTAEAVTGYRWLVPVGNNLASMCTAAADQSIAVTVKWRFWNVVWGGTFAARRELLDRIDLASWWQGTVTDDLQMTRALWAKGLMAVVPSGMLLASPVTHTWTSAIEFGRRQYILIRKYMPGLWIFAALTVTLPLLAMIAAIVFALSGNLFAIVSIAIVVALCQLRAVLRHSIAERRWSHMDLPGRADTPWLVHLLTPGWLVLHAICIWLALFSSKITWGGIKYDILGRQRVHVTRR